MAGKGSLLLKTTGAVCLSILAIAVYSPAANPPPTRLDSLRAGFSDPPQSALPRVYWWWLESNISLEGISRDLEEMKRKGIGGAMIYDASSPVSSEAGGIRFPDPVPAGPPLLSQEWQALFQHTLREADRLGLEMSLNLGSGWDCGGPWITPEHAAQKIVWSEQTISGPAVFDDLLALPRNLTGNNSEVPPGYRDIAVLAVPAFPPDERDIRPALSTPASDPAHPVGHIYDGDLSTSWKPAVSARSDGSPSAQECSIRFDFETPFTAAALYLAPGLDATPTVCDLQHSTDGQQYESVVRFDLLDSGPVIRTFAGVNSAHYRLIFSTPSTGVPPIERVPCGLLEIRELRLLRNGETYRAAGAPPIRQWAVKAVHFLPPEGTRWDALLHRSPEIPDETAFTGKTLPILQGDVSSGVLQWGEIETRETPEFFESESSPEVPFGSSGPLMDGAAGDGPFGEGRSGPAGDELVPNDGGFAPSVADGAFGGNGDVNTNGDEDWGAGGIFASAPARPTLEWGQRAVSRSSVINLTGMMDGHGRLVWEVPPGAWAILRFGHEPTGVEVSTCSPGGAGLMLDHLSREAMDLHFDTMAGPLIDGAGELNGRSLKYLHCDSWELGPVNWSPRFMEEFRHRREYDPLPYLPVIAGRIVGSREISNRFLEDFRRTIGDCIADNHYGRFRELAHRHGLEYHSESGGPHPAPIDALQCLGRNDIPMGEFWAAGGDTRTTDWRRFFVKQCASAAHIYGKTLVAAEGFTTIGPHWAQGPAELKPVADRAFCDGVNRIFLHTFTHSPAEAGLPGNEYFAGTHFNPNITWWPQAGAWTGYLARCQFLLQQGRYVADVCYYSGDHVPNFVPLKHLDPSLGPGYGYDVTNSEALLNRMSVKDGWIVLPDGMRYRVLVLPESRVMPLPVLEKVAELVEEGATVVGPRPDRTSGLSGYPHCDTEFRNLAGTLWGACDSQTVFENRFGKGRILWSPAQRVPSGEQSPDFDLKLREILLDEGQSPDFEYHSSMDGAGLDFIHRREGGTDIYFVVNRLDRREELVCTFRVSGKRPEIWNPVTGETRSAAIFSEQGERTSLPLSLPPHGSLFVLFHEEPSGPHIVEARRADEILFPLLTSTSETAAGSFADPTESANSSFNDLPADFCSSLPLVEAVPGGSSSRELRFRDQGTYSFTLSTGKKLEMTVESLPAPVTIPGPWEIRFPSGWGAPPSVAAKTLKPWTTFRNPGIRFFSGTAAYQTEFQFHGNGAGGKHRHILDLGEVKNIARVTLNGIDLGILWHPPLHVDITTALKPGNNRLQVEVTNYWPNRIIGDQKRPPAKRLTRTNVKAFTVSSPLTPSGLLGPVRILTSETRRIDL